MNEHRARCKTCKRTARTDPPNGWYNLSVDVPPEINERKYIWIGVFCSPKCLALYMPDVRLMSEYTEGLYERA